MKRFAVLLLMVTTVTGFSQVIEYNQHFNTPTFVNPATMAGVAEGNIYMQYKRLSLSGGSGFSLPSLTFVQPLRYQKNRQQFGSASLTVLQEQSGINGMVQTSALIGGFAYRINIDKHNFIGAGIQAGYFGRRLNMSRVTTDGQYGDNGFDPTAPTGENIAQFSARMPQFNAGLTWFRQTKNNRPLSWFGVALYNIGEPKFSLIDENGSLPVSLKVSGGYHLETITTVSFTPSFRAITADKTFQLMLGSDMNYEFGEKQDKSMLKAGLYYNSIGAATLFVGADTFIYALGLSYDLYLKGNDEGTRINNATELFFALKFRNPKNHN